LEYKNGISKDGEVREPVQLYLVAKPGVKRKSEGFPFLEFFAGIGLVRYALEKQGWNAVYANDISSDKEQMYCDHFGADSSEFDLGDIHKLDAKLLPSALLATASFPCTDLSLAGAREGLDLGKQSSAFWGFISVLKDLGARRPPVVMLENVTGFLTSDRGRDFKNAMLALNKLGYAVDTFIVDAERFVPQSRKRLFVIGVDRPLCSFEHNSSLSESDSRPKALVDFIKKNEDIDWAIRPLVLDVIRTASLRDVIEDIPLNSKLWWSVDRADYLVSQMSEKHREIAEGMIHKKRWSYGTVFRRVRYGKSMAELRTDGVAGCLRTPKGGSAKQILFKAGYGKYHVRLLSARECARLMGADDFELRVPPNQAYFGFGDAVCVPVIEWIAQNYLNPLIENILKFSSARLEDRNELNV